MVTQSWSYLSRFAPISAEIARATTELARLAMQKQTLKVTSPTLEPALRILVVGRDVMSGHLLAEALGRDRRYDASATVSAHLLSRIAASKTDIVVISADLISAPRSGFELVDSVSRSYPEILIVMLLDQPDRESVIRAFRCGARGVFSRREGIPEFLDCIEHVQKGGIWAGRLAANYLLDAFKSIPAPSVFGSGGSPALTKREAQVVHCAAEGKTNRTIANELSLSEHTVKNYLFRAFEKLGVSSRVELLFYLTTQGHSFRQISPGNIEWKRPSGPYQEALEGD
jgi:two-component system, NarL family, nitrate/nitrite response regulator NarL